MIRRYEDFEVIITKQGDQLYAELGAAPDSRHLLAPIPITLPDDRSDWIEVCQGRKSESELAELGHRLFTALIADELAEKWHACLNQVNQEPDIGLRLRFSLQANTLNQVPLELLCRQAQPTSEFLALDSKMPIVRSPRFGGGAKKRPIIMPLRMLVVIANPMLQRPTDSIYERESLEGALVSLIESRKLIIDYLGLPGYRNADYDTLHHRLVQAEYPYDIVHFIGHGMLPDTHGRDSEGVLLFVDPVTGRRQDVRVSNLANLLADNGIRVAILQACEGAHGGADNAFKGIAQRLVAKGLPAVLAMQSSIDMDVATWFCGQFYSFWLEKSGLPIERAVTEARLSVRQYFDDRASAWVAPALFIRQESTEVLRVTLDRSLFRARLKLGVVLLEQSQMSETPSQDWIDEAVDVLQQAHRQNPKQACIPLTRALVTQARICQKLGDKDGALRACEQALEVWPNGQTAYDLKESLLRQRRETEEREQAKQGDSRQTESQIDFQETASEDWPPGHILDERYEILERIDTTDRCEIYKAKERRYARCTVAIKRLKRDKLSDKDALERFEREVAILRQIEDRSILRFLGDGKTEHGAPYYVTPFADKGSLKDYLRDKSNQRLSPGEALSIARSICKGIASLHSINVIHRDIKPDNILLFSKTGRRIEARLADFGIASVPKEWTETESKVLFAGTYAYSAPEQFRGKRGDRRSDFYSWAIVLLEMLTGKHLAEMLPIERSINALLVYYQRSDANSFSPSFFVDRGVPQEFDHILQKALHGDPECRYQSITELQKELESIIPPSVSDVERHLEIGKEYKEAARWQDASIEFEKGLELCKWYGELDDLTGQLKELAQKLKAGCAYAQGMLHFSQERWQAAVESFEELRELDPTDSEPDIAEKLKQARLKLELERKYDRVLQLMNEQSWTAVWKLTEEFDESYQGQDGTSILEIRKHALYDQGKKLVADEPGRAYNLLYDLYKQDPGYKDVAELCAKVAYENSACQDISSEQQVEWLERATEVDPSHGEEGRAQWSLDNARHRWAKELLEEDEFAAISQLEKISTNYTRYPEVFQTLVNIYYRLLSEGNYTGTEKPNRGAEAEARYRLGVKRWGEGDSKGAIEQLGEIRSEDTQYKGAQFALGQIRNTTPYQKNQEGKANSDIEAGTRLRLGIELWDNLEDVVKQLEKVRPEAKEYQSAQSALAQIYITLGRQKHTEEHWQEAAKWWKKALNISPSEGYRALVSDYHQLLRDGSYSHTKWTDSDAEAKARYRLGMELWAEGDLEGAIEQLEQLVENQRFLSVQAALFHIYETLGSRERKKKHWRKAEEWFKKALATSRRLKRMFQ